MALAYVLHTSIQALMAPSADDEVIDLPSAVALDAASVYRSTTGMNDGGILWEADEPYLSYAEGQELRRPRRIWPPVGMSAGTGQRIKDQQDQVAELQRQLAEQT